MGASALVTAASAPRQRIGSSPTPWARHSRAWRYQRCPRHCCSPHALVAEEVDRLAFLTSTTRRDPASSTSTRSCPSCRTRSLPPTRCSQDVSQRQRSCTSSAARTSIMTTRCTRRVARSRHLEAPAAIREGHRGGTYIDGALLVRADARGAAGGGEGAWSRRAAEGQPEEGRHRGRRRRRAGTRHRKGRPRKFVRFLKPSIAPLHRKPQGAHTCPHARAVGHVGRRRCLQFHLGERRKRERQLQHGGGAAARSRQVFCGTPHNTAERWPCCGAEADSGALGPATGPPCALRCTLIFFDRCSTWAPTSAMNA